MKHTYIKSLIALSISVALLTTTGCKKLEDFGSTDTRTDQSSEPTTSYLLSNAMVGVPGVFSSTAGGIRGELYVQHWAETQYTDVSLYGNPQLDFGSYSGALMDLQRVIDLNSDDATKSGFNVVGTLSAPTGSNGSQIAIAKILKVYLLWTITDRWGDAPYKEALKGLANFTPAYDKQEDFYKQLLTDLKDAIASFDPSAAVRGDVFFPVASSPLKATTTSINAQIASWKKVANSLRMLIALRMSKVYPNVGEYAATEFADAATDPGGSISVNSENLVSRFTGASATETNLFYSALNGRKDYAFSKTFADILSNMSDPRRAAFGSSGAAFPYGLPRDLAVAFDGSVAGAYATPIAASFRATSSPIVILPASYVLLAKAEAAQRGWISGNAQTFYEAGVTESFKQWGQTAGAAATYLNNSAANFASGSGGGTDIGFSSDYPSIVGADASTGTPLERIQLQRYIASFGDGIQAWAEWRRTGVPNLKPTAFGTNSPKEIPRRLTYGTTEYAANTVNVNEAAGRYAGGDKMNSRMWWDQ